MRYDGDDGCGCDDDGSDGVDSAYCNEDKILMVKL